MKNLKLFQENSISGNSKNATENNKNNNKNTNTNTNNNFTEERQKIKNKNILLILTDKPFTKKDLNSLIDLASYLKTDIITYFSNFNNITDLKKTIKNIILINKIFLHLLLKNKYNLPTTRINLFILGEFTSSLESLITTFYLQKLRKGEYLKKIKVKGLILENSIYLKETLNFLFPQFDQKFIIPTFFIFGKFSVFSQEFFNEYKTFKNKFVNLTEFFPEEGDMSNINKEYRNFYFEKIKNFLKKFEKFKFKNGILLKNKNKKKKNNSFHCKKNFQEDYNNDITLVDFNKRKSFIVDFDIENLTKKEKDKIKRTITMKKKVDLYFKKISRKYSVFIDKKFKEKKFENETLSNLTMEKHFDFE